jgi:hypothetical protein
MENIPTKVDNVDYLEDHEFNSLCLELKNIITDSGQTLSIADSRQLSKALVPQLVQDYRPVGRVGFKTALLNGAFPSINQIANDIAYYKYLSTDILNDEVGTYDLTASANPPVADDSPLGLGSDYAARFNGVDNYYTNPTLLDTVPAAIAIDFWFRADNGNMATQMFVCKFNDETAGSIDAFEIELAQGWINFVTWQNCALGAYRSLASFTKMPYGDTGWHHCAVCWDTTNGKRVWLNGRLEAYDDNALAKTLMANGTARDFIIGATNYLGVIENFFKGSITQVRVKNVVLTDANVLAMYQAIAGTLVDQQEAGHILAVDEDGTDLAHFKFEGAAGAGLEDDEKGAFNLTNAGTVRLVNGHQEETDIFGDLKGAYFTDGAADYFTQATLLDGVANNIYIDFWTWLYDGLPAGNYTLFRRYNDANNWIGAHVEVTGDVVFDAVLNSVSNTLRSIPLNPNGLTKQPIHIACCLDAVFGIRLYVNGIMVDSRWTSTIIAGLIITTGTFYIGADNAGAQRHRGSIQQLRVKTQFNPLDVDRIVKRAVSSLYTRPTAFSDNNYSLKCFEKKLQDQLYVVGGSPKQIEFNEEKKDGTTIYRRGFDLSSSSYVRIEGVK